ncbi:MAG TPA: Kiwa anti-phage protein KwaB-like domain-containing protein, partial [Ktedonobacteraceae bacterium]|nr:Kiwa anti-phage protein KwaB-like domain-containing protein [Ktedonobacteraceae bacterium]
ADDEVISGIRFYVITLGPKSGLPVHFFRTYTPKKELSRSPWFVAFLHNGQFDHSSTPTFLFDTRIDCFSVGKHMFVVQKTNFQTIFQFLEQVTQTATETLSVIRSRIPIYNFEQFAEDCQAHVQKLVKLNNIAHMPYLNTITMEDIRDVIRSHLINPGEAG